MGLGRRLAEPSGLPPLLGDWRKARVRDILKYGRAGGRRVWCARACVWRGARARGGGRGGGAVAVPGQQVLGRAGVLREGRRRGGEGGCCRGLTSGLVVGCLPSM